MADLRRISLRLSCFYLRMASFKNSQTFCVLNSIVICEPRKTLKTSTILLPTAF